MKELKHGCGWKNFCRNAYCGKCGEELPEFFPPDERFYSDVVHPVTNTFREKLERMVIRAYEDYLKNTVQVVPTDRRRVEDEQVWPQSGGWFEWHSGSLYQGASTSGTMLMWSGQCVS